MAETDISASRSSDQLAMDRTVLAAERTLMAWMRTSFSMIGFGFTIYNFLKSFEKEAGAHMAANRPRNLGMALISIGTAALIVAIVQHVSFMKKMGQGRSTVWSLATIVAMLISLIGALAFLSLAARVGPF